METRLRVYKIFVLLGRKHNTWNISLVIYRKNFIKMCNIRYYDEVAKLAIVLWLTPLKPNGKFYKSILISTLSYGIECWSIKKICLEDNNAFVYYVKIHVWGHYKGHD